jgi:hypothetical protein
LQKVTLEVEVEKYISIVTLSVKRNGRMIKRSYQIIRNNDSLNLAHIKCIKEGLRHIIEPVQLIFKLKAGYITISLQSVEKWRKNGFLNKSGKEIKYAKEWKEIAEMLSVHEYEIEFKKEDKEID